MLFQDITTRQELANKLECPVDALGLAVLIKPLVECDKEGCGFPAFERNNGCCVVCSKSWYPQVGTSCRGTPKHQRGHFLLGTGYMRGNARTHSCDCDNSCCIGIGYSSSMITFPSKQDRRKQWYTALGNNLTTEKRKQINLRPRNFKLAHWHFHADHLVYDSAKSRYVVKKKDSYVDSDGKKWACRNSPPPNASVSAYKSAIESKNTPSPTDRWVTNTRLPDWISALRRLEKKRQKEEGIDASDADTPLKRRRIFIDPMEERAVASASKNQTLEEEIVLLREKLEAQKEEMEQQKKKWDDEREDYKDKNQALKKQVEAKETEIRRIDALLEDANVKLKKSGQLLTFDSLREGGVLAKHVKDFTFFTTVEANEAFLDMLNFADGTDGSCRPGDGLCERLIRYSTISVDQRIASQQGTDSSSATSDAGGSSDARLKKGGSNRKLHFKTEWLVYNLYVHAGWTQEQIAPLVGTGYTCVHNAIYGWANLLNDALQVMFPVPTRSQMLHAYPFSLYSKFGHCRIFELLDATEQYIQDASRLKVHAAVFSTYKNHPTVKFLAGCDGIGTSWYDLISDAYPGAISDPVVTKITGILDSVPFGMLAEVDKGFLIENIAIMRGVLMERPKKMLKKQIQQAPEDTHETQKIGKTRIPVEQLNGGAKLSTRWLQGSVPNTQIGLLSLVMRVSFLMQNFRPGYVQGRQKSPENGRPSRAEVRYYGETEDGLFDARPHYKLWGLTSEITRWEELREQHPATVTDTEISEMVLDEKIPEKLRQELLETLGDE